MPNGSNISSMTLRSLRSSRVHITQHICCGLRPCPSGHAPFGRTSYMLVRYSIFSWSIYRTFIINHRKYDIGSFSRSWMAHRSSSGLRAPFPFKFIILLEFRQIIEIFIRNVYFPYVQRIIRKFPNQFFDVNSCICIPFPAPLIASLFMDRSSNITTLQRFYDN